MTKPQFSLLILFGLLFIISNADSFNTFTQNDDDIIKWIYGASNLQDNTDFSSYHKHNDICDVINYLYL